MGAAPAGSLTIGTSTGFVRNAWYVAAWSHELAADDVFARTLLGRPIVFYRSTERGVVALDDRCVHRAAPLSMGRREGDNLRCMYHGLLFAPDGRCVEVPNQQRVPESFCVKSYPVLERQQLVWIWMGDAALADTSKVPDMHWLDDAAWRAKPAYIHYDANYLLILDNLLDFSHLTYVHPTTLGNPAIAAARPEIEPMDFGVRVTRRYPGMEPIPFHKRVGGFAGRVDMSQIYDWIAPGVFTMDTETRDAGNASGAAKLIRFHHLSFFTPETADSTHYFFAQPRDFALDDAAMDDTVLDMVKTAFAEDKRIIEAQQKVINATPELSLSVMAVDRGLIEARRKIDALLALET
jgi:phenylpropionate dioxygenase-like ring-hydroxylating dioxygenase large terminal subunit